MDVDDFQLFFPRPRSFFHIQSYKTTPIFLLVDLPAALAIIQVLISLFISKMSRKQISTDKAPQPVAPYSQAMVANGLVFVSGNIGLDLATNKIPEGSTVGENTVCSLLVVVPELLRANDEKTRALKNMEAVLQAAGSGLDKLLKV